MTIEEVIGESAIAKVQYVNFSPDEEHYVAHVETGRSFGFIRGDGNDSQPVFVEEPADAEWFRDHPDFQLEYVE